MVAAWDKESIVNVLVQTVVVALSWPQDSGCGEVETQGKEASAAGSTL